MSTNYGFVIYQVYIYINGRNGKGIIVDDHIS
jgi:hypothetical protein